MSNIVPFQPQGQAPAALSQELAKRAGQPSAFTQGIGAGYANVSFKGKVFQIRYNGQVTHLVDPNTKAPMQYFDVVLVAAKDALSKTYYAGAYAEGDNAAPDCSSEDGVHPTAPAGKQVICHDCRVCPMNAFGSKVSTDGRATNSKACQDTRKVAIVPEWNLRNENFGGGMLLRIPPDSLKALAQYARGVEAQGGLVNAVVTRIMFDYTVSHPKLTFQSVRWLSDAEYDVIRELEAGQGVQDIISVNAAPQQQALPAPVQGIPGQAPSQVQQAPVQAPVANSAPAPGYAQPAPVAQPTMAAPQMQPQMQPGPQAQPQLQPAQSYGPPPPQPQPYQAPQAAPGVPSSPTSIQQSFPQQAPVQQAPVMQPPPGYQPQQAPVQPQMQPAQGTAQPTFQQPGAVPSQPLQSSPLPQQVLSSVDALIG